MTRILNNNRSTVLPTQPGTTTDATTRPQTTRVHSTNSYSRAGGPVPLTEWAGAATTGRTSATVGAQAVASTGPSVQLDPIEMLGNLHSGDIRVELPLDPSLIDHPLVRVDDNATARVRWAVRDGQIDFQNSVVQVEGIRAAGIFDVRGAYFDDKGKLRLNMTGPDINISNAVVGRKRMPRSMEDFANAISEKHLQGNNRGERSNGGGAAQALEQIRFSAEGVALRPDRALSLGAGNSINFKPGTRVDVAGNLNQVQVQGRASVNGVNLSAGSTGISLGDGVVSLRATARRQNDGGVRVDVNLQNLNLDVNRLQQSVGEGGLDIQNATVRNGSVQMRLDVDGQGNTTIPGLRTQGSFAASSLRYNDGSRRLDSDAIRFDLEAQSRLDDSGLGVSDVRLENARGHVRQFDVESADGQHMNLQDAYVEGASLIRERNAAGDFEHSGGIDHFSGTIDGKLNHGGVAGAQGSTQFERTRAEGTLQFDQAGVTGEVQVTEGTGRTHTVMDRSNIDLGDYGNVTIAAGSRADFELASAALGRTLKEGRLEANGRLQGRLEDGQLNIGDHARLDLREADIDLNLRSVDKREGETLPRFEGDLKLSLDSNIELDQNLLRRAGVTSVTDARGKVSLDLQGASLNGDGRLEVNQANVQLEATVGEISGRIGLPGQLALQEPAPATTTDPVTSNTAPSEPRTYTVQSGDTLGRIASNHNTTVADLARINSIANPDRISVGQELKLEDTPTVTSAPIAGPEIYTVKSGDTLGRIASNHNTTVADLARINSIANPDRISVGQELKLRESTAPASSLRPVARPGQAASTTAPAPAAPTTTAANAAESTAPMELSLPEVQMNPTMNEPLSFNPIDIAGRIQNGEVEIDLPLNEAGIEEATQVLGVNTLDLEDNTRLQGRLVVEDGQIDFERSSFRFNKPPSAAGLVEVNPHLSDDGKIKLGVAGMNFNITRFVTGSSKLPSNMSDLGQLLGSSESNSASASSSSANIDDHLNTGNQYLELGNIRLKADNVSLAPGRLQIGDNDYIEVGANNRVSIDGNSQSLNITGEIEANDAYVDLGGTVMDLGTGRIGFDATVKTGLSEAGELNQRSSVDVNFRVPEANVERLQVSQPDGRQVELRNGSIQGAVVSMSHSFERGENGEIQYLEDAAKNSLSIDSFAGELRNTSIGLVNEDGTPGSVDIVSAQSQGSFQMPSDGPTQLSLTLDHLDARVSDLNIATGATHIQGLDGRLTGSGTIRLDSDKGIALDGNFRAEARMDDGRMALNGVTDLDLGRDSRATLNLTELNTMGERPKLQGDLEIEADLDSGEISLPDGQTFRFEEGSKLQLSTQLGQDQDGHVARMNGTIFADLGRQEFHHSQGGAEISGELQDGTARIDLGDITVHEDGRYRIVNPEVRVNMDLNLLGRQI